MSAERQPRVCVTGGAGFIGARVVAGLLSRGCQVSVLDNLSVGRPERVPAGARLVVGDIRDRRSVLEAIDACDVVLHLAARVAIRSSFECAAEDGDINYVGTASVMTAAAEAGVRRVVFASSMAVYADAPGPRPLAETYAALPVAPYGISKLASEQLVHLIGRRHGIHTTVLRLFNTFGPGQQYSPYVGVVTIFVNRLQALEPVEIFGDGLQARDFVHVDDVASAFVTAAQRDIPTGQTMNIGSGMATAVNDVYQHVQRALGTQVRPVMRPAVAGELRYSVADISKARHLLGYEPTHLFAMTIGQVVTEIVGAVQ